MDLQKIAPLFFSVSDESCEQDKHVYGRHIRMSLHNKHSGGLNICRM